MRTPEKSVSATEIKNRFGDYLGEVVRCKEPLLIERHGKPTAVIIPFVRWEGLEEKRRVEENPWIKSLQNLLKKIETNHPNAKPSPAVELIRSIREGAE